MATSIGSTLNGKCDILSAPEFVEFYVTTSKENVQFLDTKRFRKDLTVSGLKQRLEVITGRNAETMNVLVLNTALTEVCKLSEDGAALDNYPVSNGMVLYVDDKNFVDFIDDEVDNRYKLSEDQYNSKRGTLKEFLMKNKLGKYNPELILKEEDQKKQLEEKDKEAYDKIDIGARCQVAIPNVPHRRGVVLFKGEVEFQPGLWVGVRYDEPFGRNDGTVGGVRYFESPPKYGAFVKPCYVETGDFPEINELDSDEEF